MNINISDIRIDETIESIRETKARLNTLHQCRYESMNRLLDKMKKSYNNDPKGLKRIQDIEKKYGWNSDL